MGWRCRGGGGGGVSPANGVTGKCIVKEKEQAQKVIDAAHFFKDDVFTRICDLVTVQHLLPADLHYHTHCLHTYISTYEYKSQPKSTETLSASVSSQRTHFEKYIPFLQELTEGGHGVSLTDIRDIIKEECMIEIKTCELKNFRSEAFGESIQFCKPESKNESMLVFSLKISVSDVVNTIRSTDISRTDGLEIRKALMTLEFGLENKFCDAQELENAWENTSIPDTVITFLAALFNIKRISFLQGNHDHSNLDQLSEENVPIKLMSVIQIMYYMIHHGQKMTPLHVMNSHAIYEACKSRDLITSFNRLGLCVSYNSMKRQRTDMAKYAILEHSNRSIIPMPAHLSPTAFTLAAFDHLDRNSLTGSFGAHDTAITLFQENENALKSKPWKSQVQLSTTLERLPCQKVIPYNMNKTMVIPENFTVEQDLLMNEEVFLKHQTEFLISCVRNVYQENPFSNKTPT